ncbi:hypothetical protein RvY_07099 [Ramazzottius varieornatus]|uniref:Chromo domain-containing protein n=1 Tax=Ramazzottius varieornatus TaxID=947166 RepID=A0A1D1VAC9_RAMVA|nr:hypothetical protein RvY_07099 [Ramazzottius varieornatus]
MDFARSIFSFLSPTKHPDIYRPAATGGAPVWKDYYHSSDDESINQAPPIIAMPKTGHSSPVFAPPKKDPSWWKDVEGLGTNRSKRSYPNLALDANDVQEILEMRTDGKVDQFLVKWKRPQEDGELTSWVNRGDIRLNKVLANSFMQEQENRAIQESRDIAQATDRSYFQRAHRRTHLPEAKNNKRPVILPVSDVADVYAFASSADEADNSFKKEKGLGTRRQPAKENLNSSLANYTEECRRRKLKKERNKAQAIRVATRQTSTPIQIDDGSSDDDVVEDAIDDSAKNQSPSLTSPVKRMKMSSSPSNSNSSGQRKSTRKPTVQDKKVPIPAPRKGKSNGSTGFQTNLDPFLQDSSSLSRKAEHVLDRFKKPSRLSEKHSATQAQTFDLTKDDDEEDAFKVDHGEVDLLDPVVGSVEEVETYKLSDSVREVSVEPATEAEVKPEQNNYLVYVMDNKTRPPGFQDGQQVVEKVCAFGTTLYPVGSMFFVQYKDEEHPRCLTKKQLLEWQPNYKDRVEMYLEAVREAHPGLEMAKDEDSIEQKQQSGVEQDEDESEEWEEVPSAEGSGKKEKNSSVLDYSVLA